MDEARGKSWRWWVLLTVIFGTFLGRLDQTVVNLALPKIVSDFGVTITDVSWIATAYILANAVFVPVWGKLGDIAGRKKIYLIGFAGFIAASGLCGLAWNLSSMVVFRIVQGFAVSADYPTAMAILAVTFAEGKERAQALGLWSASFAVASVFGPLIGGPIIDIFGWRAIFFMNVPLGILGLLLAITIISESVGEKRSAHFDWWGSIALAGALFSLTLVLDRGQAWGWASPASIITYLATAGFTALFLRIESRETEPIVDLKFFKIKVFVFTLLNSFVIFLALMGSLFLVPLFAQTFLGLDATQTGYLFIPMAVLLMIAAAAGGRLIGKVETRWVLFIGTLVAAAGIYTFSFLDPRSSALAIMIPLGIMSFGLGFGMAQRTNIIASAVPKEEVGEASAILALVRNVSGAFGVAIFSTILESATNSQVLALSQNSILRSVNPEAVRQFIGLIILKAEVNSYAIVYYIASILLVAGAFLALLIKVPKHIEAEHKGERVVVAD